MYYNQEQYNNNNIQFNNNQEQYNNSNNNKRAITPNFKLYNINKNEYKNYLANRNYDNYYEEENNEYQNNNNNYNNNNIPSNEQNYSNIPNNNNYSNIPYNNNNNDNNYDNNNNNNNNNYNEYISNNEEYQKYLSNKKMLEEFQNKNNNNNLYNEVSNNITNNSNYSYHNNINNNINNNNNFPQEISPKYISNSNYISKYSQNQQQQPQQQQQIPIQKIIPQEQIYNNYLQSIKNKGDLPFDNLEENSYEYLQNKKKNIATYANLTHTTTLTPSLKVIPSNSYNNMDEEKIKELNLKREKIRKYKESLDMQIKNRPKSAYRPFNNDRRIEVPPDPFVEHGYKIKNNF